MVFDIVFDDLFAGILANRVYIIAFCPELSTPQFPFDFGVFGEDLLGGDAFDDSHEVGGGDVWNGLYEEVHMVFIRSHLVESYLEPFLDTATHILQRLGNLWGEYVPSVFHWADQVVQEERFVVTLQDMFAHQLILAPECPRSRAARQSLRVYRV